MDLLDQMINDGLYKECLATAEQLLLGGHNSISELSSINLAIARCRMWLRDYIGAVPAAQLGFKIARDQKLTDLLLKAFDVLGGAYLYSRQYDKVVSIGYEYYELVPPPHQTPVSEGKICNAIGFAEYSQQHYTAAMKSYLRAAGCFRRAKDLESVLRNVIWSIRCAHALGDYVTARNALAEAMRLARSLPAGNWVHQAILVQRSENATGTGRSDRCAMLALRALALQGAPEPRIRALLLLHKYHLERGEYKDAIGYALAARVTALDARWYHLEYEAAEAMMHTMQAASTEDLFQLDQEYLSTGVDISRYLPDSVLRNRA